MAKYEEVEAQLDQEVIHDYINKLKEAIDVVSDKHSNDTSLELLTVLLSFAAQVGQEIQIEDKSYFTLAKEFFIDAAKENEQYEEDQEGRINTFSNTKGDKKQLN